MASSKPPKLVPRTQLPNPRPPGMLGVFLGRIETRTVLGTPLRPASQVIPPRRLLPAVNVVAWRRSNLIGRGEDTPQDALCQPANFGACISRYATRHQRHDVAECPAGMGQTPARRTNGDVGSEDDLASEGEVVAAPIPMKPASQPKNPRRSMSVPFPLCLTVPQSTASPTPAPRPTPPPQRSRGPPLPPPRSRMPSGWGAGGRSKGMEGWGESWDGRLR
jgi:hypothetical protein